MLDHFRRSLDTIAAKHRMRALRAVEMQGDGRLVRDGRELLDLSSNDYLGLSRHPLLVERSTDYVRRYGAGSGASRLITGTSAAHLAIEKQIAAFKGSEAALIFATGWQANAAAIPALARAAKGTVIFADRLVHNSIHTGLRAASGQVHLYDHNDYDHLARLLADHDNAPARLIITESVFSMDGDKADLARLNQLCANHDALLYIDEAHATGVLGARGAGLTADFPVPEGSARIVMGTFSKALGGFGAYIACPDVVYDYLVNMCAGLIFTTAPPPAMLGAMDAVLEIVPEMKEERAHLAALGEQLRAGLHRLGYDTLGSTTQIVPFVVGTEAAALALGNHLMDHGVAALPIRPPTVAKGTSRIRFALRSTLTEQDIETVLSAVASWEKP